MNKKRGRVYIIAEIGINHNGSLSNCLKLIDVSAAAGCDAAKFQFFKTKRLYPRSAGSLDWSDGNKKYSYGIYDAARSSELPEKWISEITGYCRSKDIEFLSSVCDTESAEYLVKKGMKKIKIPSYAVTNIPLIERCAGFGLPIIASTGGSTLGEVEDAFNAINRSHNKVSFLHCSIKYPSRLKECNLGVIETLQRAFPESRVGYSDHTKEVSDAAIQAVYLGAGIIEKHITLDKSMKGPDHFFALEPDELKRMVGDIRKAEVLSGKGKFKINKMIYGETARITYGHEKYLRDFAYMKLFAKRKLSKGGRIRPSDIIILRPGKKAHGLDPKYMSLFSNYAIAAKKDIGREEPITWRSILG